MLIGFREGGGDRPRGFYRFDGIYSINFAEDGYKTVRTLLGREHNVRTDID